MPELAYSLICTDVIVDRETGSASYIKVFEHGTVPELPAQVPPFFVAMLWKLDQNAAQAFQVSLTLVTPTGNRIPLGKNDVLPSEAALHKINFRMPGLHVEAEGYHEILVHLIQGKKQTTVARMPLHIFLRPPEQ